MRSVRKEEVQRKILHIFSGTIIPGGIFYVPRWLETAPWMPPGIAPKWIPPLVLAAITAVFAVVEILRLRHDQISKLFQGAFGSMLRHEEQWKFTGATYICAASLICSVLFVNHPYISAMALSTFIWGDAVAALVGQSMGRIRIGKKSLEGSTACLALCLASFLLLFPAVPHLLDAWNGRISLGIAIAASLCITVMELFPIRIGGLELNDNLTAPVIAGVLLLTLQQMGA